MKNLSPHLLFAGMVAVVCGVLGYFYFFNQFWTHVRTDGFQALTEYPKGCFQGHRGRQILVHRAFCPVMERLETYAAARSLRLLVTASFRPRDRKLTDAVAAPAVRSNHLAGHALDFNVIHNGKIYESEDLNKAAFHRLPEPVQGFIEDIRHDGAMRWGGDFETEDPVHVDDGLNLHSPETWDAHFRASDRDYAHAERKWKWWIKNLFSL